MSNGDESSPGESSSPTTTILNVSPPLPSSAQQAMTPAQGARADDLPIPGPSGGGSGPTRSLYHLGKGRPGFRDGADQRRPSRIDSDTTPSTLRIPRRSPSATPSTSSTPDGDHDAFSVSSNNRPRSAFQASRMDQPDQTPRGGGSQRGYPQTAALGSSFGSPNPPFHRQMSSGGSMPHPSRLTRYNTTADPSSQPVNPANMSASGTMSRSASRARPAINTTDSGGILTQRSEARDEEDLEDRGQALIRQRQKERKQARRAKEKERERRMLDNDGMASETSAPPTGQPVELFSVQQARGCSIGPAGGRSISRSRTASANRLSRQASEGYFASGGHTAGLDTPRDEGPSPRDERRAPSILSSAADEDEEEVVMDRASIVGDVVQEVLEEEVGEGDEDEEEGDIEEDDEGVTLKDRQDAINIEHPFGLPIWKPALYRKSRSVTRNAESALHAIPSAAAERHLFPGNLLWVMVFGWWLALTCFLVAVSVSGAEVLGGGRGGYGKTLRGLAWYIGWPFGKYVEGEGGPDEESEDDEEETENGVYGTWGTNGSPIRYRRFSQREPSDGASSGVTVRDLVPRAPNAQTSHDGAVDGADSPTQPETATTVRPVTERREPTVSFATGVRDQATDQLRGLNASALVDGDERMPLLVRKDTTKGAFRRPRNKRAKLLGRMVYWPLFLFVVAPLMLLVCMLCWGMIVTIPMAKLTWALLELLALRPLEINFRAAPKFAVPTLHGSPGSGDESGGTTLAGSGGESGNGKGSSPGGYTIKRARLKAGQVAPTPGYKSTVLLCTYRSVGLQYYKYTIGGVNIVFINTIPLVFFAIIDAFLILPAVEAGYEQGRHFSPLVELIASQAFIFVLSLASVIPLSYFIGMAVASISAQSSIGMGAVINATFGSVIEIVLYAIALMQGKGRLVEGSIVGSILAGVLLMPGASMCSGALKRKEQRFNAKSAGVTSTMLIMAIIGTLTPTMFYQTYGSFELHCLGCPDLSGPSGPLTLVNGTIGAKDAWMCDSCFYEHPDPASDPFYQDNVKTLMYACAGILLFSYLIGLWFSLRTHAAQIWQNPQQLMKPEDHLAAAPGLHPAVRSALQQRVTPQAVLQHVLPLHKSGGTAPGTGANSPSAPMSQASTLRLPPPRTALLAPAEEREEASRVSSGEYSLPAGYTPFLQGVDRDMKTSHLTPMRLPSTLTTEDFTRAVAVATVSALRHQGSIIGSQPNSGRKERPAAPSQAGGNKEEEEHQGGGHEAPSWTRGVSAGVLLGCTLLYAIIAEILVDVVDVVLQGSGIDEKFLGLTLFALVPNTTEFMNAMSFALNGNIALSMEIGSAYALQVCLLQIPAMVAFSALYDPGKLGEMVDTFTLIFPRWDVIAIILSIFLLTYTYIEARSNYHRGSILVLAYVVLMMGFYYAPPKTPGEIDDMRRTVFSNGVDMAQAGSRAAMTKLWA